MFNLFPKKKSVDEILESNDTLYASIKKEASDLASGVVNGVYEIIALKNELQHQLDENAKLMKEIKDLKGMQKGYIHERDTAREVNAKLLKEKEELEAQLKSIEEDGTEEHNAAVKLRQENAKLKDEIAKWEKDWDEQNKVIIDLNERVNEIDSDQNEKYRAEILTLKNDIAVLKNRNTELLEKYNGFVTMGGLKYMEAKLQIVQNNYKKCTEQRDEFKHQLNASNKEIEQLKRWKKEQLTVQSWWDKVDSYVRDHDDAPLGGFVANTCLNFLKERDELKKRIDGLSLTRMKRLMNSRRPRIGKRQ